jgi:hypothetical protein
MKKSHVILFVSLSLIFGAVGGWFAAGYRYGQWANNFASSATLGDLGEAYSALQSARAGDTNIAVEMLESRLDVAIIDLAAKVRETADSKKRDGYLRALARARDYRAVHPRTTDSPEFDGAVAQALSVASTP